MNTVQSVHDIEIYTLDSIWPEIVAEHRPNSTFLKLDTQGNDINVIQGFLKNIENVVGFQSEVYFTEIYKDTPKFRDALAFYEGLNFFISAMTLPNRGHYPRLIDMDVIMLNKRFFGEQS
jgi:hypothetical protein